MSWRERLRNLPRQLPYVWLFCMLAGLLFSLITVLCSNEWPVEGLLYSDRMDVLMDHFNSIRTVRNGNPYLEYRTTYPPLAALFYTFFYSLLTDDAVALFNRTWYASARPLRYHSSAIVPLLMLLILCTLLIASLVRRTVEGSDRRKTAAVLGLACSSGFIYAMDRGNNILLVFLLLLYYIRNYDVEHRVLRESALVALALATGLKLYPLVFGILLIRKGRIWEGVRALLYMAIFTLVPFAFFGGFAAMRQYAVTMLALDVAPVIPGALNLASVLYNVAQVTGIALPRALVVVSGAVIACVGLLFALCYRKEYKAVLFAVFAVIALAGVSTKYVLLLTILPLLYLFNHCEDRWDLFYAAVLIALNLPLCFRVPTALQGTGVSIAGIINSVLVIVMLLGLLINGAQDFVRCMQEGKWKNRFKSKQKAEAQP